MQLVRNGPAISIVRIFPVANTPSSKLSLTQRYEELSGNLITGTE
jgi:hypothetical protein